VQACDGYGSTFRCTARDRKLNPLDLPSAIPASLVEPSDEGTAPLPRRILKNRPEVLLADNAMAR